jgi:DNA invertase Pin-like site-specific DNA recombinase
MARAYSYLRFSTKEQERGDSFRRQTEAAANYAAQHGMELDTELTFQDMGVSAFRGKNAEVGALRAFLNAVEAEEVPQGSYLLVENLDRISRQHARKAGRILEEIVESGVTLVTLNDRKQWTLEAINSLDWFGALLSFFRAHDESNRKATFIREAWAGKWEKAREGDHILTSRGPAWLELVDGQWREIPDRVAIVREIFKRAAAGEGVEGIARDLNRRGIPTWRGGKQWHRTYIRRILSKPNAVGALQPMETVTGKDGKKRYVPTGTPLDNYYPAVVTDEEWIAAQASRQAPLGPKTSLRNAISLIAKCPHCGGTVVRVGKGKHAYLTCSRAKGGAGCKHESARMDYVEAALREQLAYILAQAPSPDAAAEAQRQALSREIEGLSYRIRQLVEEISGGTRSKALRQELEELEDAKAAAEEQLREAAKQEPKYVTANLTALHDAIGEDVATLNEALRRVFSEALVYAAEGVVRLRWKYAPDAELAQVRFAWPKEEGRRRRRQA